MRSLDTDTPQSWLTWFFRGLMVLGFCVLFARLLELQVIKGEYYRSLSDGNRVRRITISAPRGKIYDKNGEVLVDNIDAEIIENKTSDQEKIIREWERIYKYPMPLSHITGYVGEVNQDELDKVDPSCPEKGIRQLGTFVGRGGLEQYYDCRLRGVNGEELVEVDTLGNRVRTLGIKQASPGTDLFTTIDYKLQRKVYDLMSATPGVAIVSTPKGEILSMVSSPGFDSNLFLSTDENDKKSLSKLFDDKNLPLFNRAIGGIYQPGSIFKLVTNTAAVEEGKIDSDFRYEDTGVLRVDEFEYKNWYFTQYGGTEGVVDPVRAMARSTDTFYYKVGEMIGANALSIWAKKFGLDELTGIDLPGEIKGLVPSPEWKKATRGEKWFLGNTYHMAIGQGDLALTPLEVHRITSVVSANGMLCQPYISKEKSESCKDLDISDEALRLGLEGMKAACNPEGTGYSFFDFLPDVACKTGTAETGAKDETHAWFSVFAPADDPKIVVTILAEKGGEGSKVAAPIAREIMDFIFNP